MHTPESSSRAFQAVTRRNRVFAPCNENGFYTPLGLVEGNCSLDYWNPILGYRSNKRLSPAPNQLMACGLVAWVALQWANCSRGDTPWSHQWQRGRNRWQQCKGKRV